MSESDILVIDEYMDNDFLFEEDLDIPDIEANIRKTNDQIKKLKELQDKLEKELEKSASSFEPLDDIMQNKIEADSRSVFVGNVDYSMTVWTLDALFGKYGKIKRVSIPQNRLGRPKGFAYIEFSEALSAEMALEMDGCLLKSRRIQVMPKRTNKPGMSSTDYLGSSSPMHLRNRHTKGLKNIVTTRRSNSRYSLKRTQCSL